MSMINNRKKSKRFLTYVLFIGGSLIVGTAAGLFTRTAVQQYMSGVQPPLSPPAWVFPIVWTILYALMGISAACVWNAAPRGNKRALVPFYIQLALNFFWPILFFSLDLKIAALVLLVLLLATVVWMCVEFFRVKPLAGWLQIPYALWLCFAVYLNAYSIFI